MRRSSITTTQPRLAYLVTAIAATLPLACGGGEKPEPADPTSYRQQVIAENEQERREFVSEQKERIDELDNEIGQLEARIEHEAEFVSASERAEWRDELFELRRQREDAQARLERARNATPEEWQASRDDVAAQIDRLEAGVDMLGARIGRLFTGAPEEEERKKEEREPVRGEDEEQDEPE